MTFNIVLNILLSIYFLKMFQRQAKRQKNNEEARKHQALVRQRMLAEMRSDREKGIEN